jgi:hypothetical protein
METFIAARHAFETAYEAHREKVHSEFHEWQNKVCKENLVKIPLSEDVLVEVLDGEPVTAENFDREEVSYLVFPDRTKPCLRGYMHTHQLVRDEKGNPVAGPLIKMYHNPEFECPEGVDFVRYDETDRNPKAA